MNSQKKNTLLRLNYRGKMAWLLHQAPKKIMATNTNQG